MKFNFNPNIWGPKAWFFIDTIVLSYPNNPTDEDKITYKNFLYQLKNVLPCESCRDHYSNNIKDIPLSSFYLSSRNNLIEWIIKIHNKVNIINNKKLLNKNEFIQYYMDNYNCDIELHNDDKKNKKNITYNNFTLMLIIIIVLIFMFILYKKIEK
jgi:hypothetical protein